jgi:ceramide glucosyltransferase
MILFLEICTALSWGSGAAAVIGALYQLLARHTVRRFAAQAPARPTSRPPVTLLKPLCGDETDLYRNLRSFCALEWPALQIVFGVRDPGDPAIAVVERLIADMPERDIALVVNPAVHGLNYKVSNLINMMRAAKHDVLVISDSDMRVDAGYLDAVVGTLQRPGTGIATCLYVGAPTASVWSAIGAAGINYWFLPSATVSERLGSKIGCYGATIAIERRTLDAVGGFSALRNQLADDYELGAMVQARGLAVAVAPYCPVTMVDEPSFAALFRHELRWARTIRTSAPAGFAGSAITHTLPWAMLSLLTGSVAGRPWAVLIGTVGLSAVCRFALIADAARALGAPRPRWWLFLPRDVLSLVILVLAYFGRSVSWRDSAFRLNSVGALSEEIDGI